MNKNFTTLFSLLICSMILVACGKDQTAPEDDKNKGVKETLVTVTRVKQQPLEVTESAVGSLEGLIDPTVAAEVAARVVDVHVNPGSQVKQGQLIATLDAGDFAMQRNEAQAEVSRIQALLQNQLKTVERNQALVDKNFISQTAVDNDRAQQNVLKQQLEAAKARVGSINHSSGKTRVIAPVSGVIEKKLVDRGDYVRVGDPIVQIVSKQKLRAHLPFPERMSTVLKPGLKVRLSTPTSSHSIETIIHELKPMIAAENRSIDVIADVFDAKDWQPGASVTGEVVIGEQAAAFMLPEQSVVMRPAGEVVYIVKSNVAYQALVKTGLRQQGQVEILAGIKENDSVVVDGAGFLTDKTPVKISQ